MWRRSIMDSLRFKAIQDRIAQLPPGGISYKTIHGKRYAYYQWTENGKQYGRRVKDEELAKLTEQIEKRRRLQRLLKEEGVSAPAEEPFFAVIKKGLSFWSLRPRFVLFEKGNATRVFMSIYMGTARIGF